MKKYLSLLLLFLFITLIGCFSASKEKGSGSDDPEDEITFTQKDTVDEDFAFQSFSDVNVKLRVVDDDGKPVGGALVTVLDDTDRATRSESVVDEIIYQTFTDADGNVTLEMAISPSESSLKIVVYKAGLVEKIIYIDDTQSIAGIDGTLHLYTEDETNTINYPDSDGDGIPDKYDALVSNYTYNEETGEYDLKLNQYTKREYRIAFEDQYPVEGDADFNDVVMHVSVALYYEVPDYNKIRKIIILSKVYAAGAGFNNVSAHVNILGNTYTLYDDVKEPLTDEFGVVHQNTNNNEDFYENTVIRDLIILMDATDVSLVNKFPYDIFIFVPFDENKNVTPDKTKSDEIHFAGLTDHPEYDEKYIDSRGFPWAISVANNNWQWPAESVHIGSAFEYFDDWYIWRQTGEKDPNIPINLNLWSNYPGEGVYTKCPGFTSLPDPAYLLESE